ncbi:tenascin-like [Ruditapes philippinarum]|uniref:tenascin-like n=1 Tax=Ruditapes philippinarum TaxID=129788 RepID=UPI00295B06AC|nr:tenascin-like [Ruditapes philippinarum]
MSIGYITFVFAHIVYLSISAEYGEFCTRNIDCTGIGQVCDVNVNTCVCYAANNYSYVDSEKKYYKGQCVKDLGTDCTNVADCNGVNVICDNGKCKCNTTINYLDHLFMGGPCFAEPGIDCKDADDCKDRHNICVNGKCKCNTTTHFDVPGVREGEECETKSALGEDCAFPFKVLSQCLDNNAVCTLNVDPYREKCQCKDGFYSIGGSCVKEKIIGETCTAATQCSAENSQCTGLCTCKTGYFTKGNFCLKRYLGETCETDSHCSQITDSECSNGYCSCQLGFFKTANGQAGRCKKRHLDESCDANFHCREANSECRDSTCLCKSGYYQTVIGPLGICIKRYLDQSCEDDSQCKEDKSECTSNKCLCKNGYYQTGTGSNGTCTKQEIGEACSDSDQCSAVNTECYISGSGVCRCQYGYYDTNGPESGGSCALKVSLGGICPQPTASVQNTATCFDNNTRCMSDGNFYTCQCVGTYYDNQNSKSRRCILRKALGETCDKPVYNKDQCLDSSASCIYESMNDVQKCKCNDKYRQIQAKCAADTALGTYCNAASTVVNCSDPSAQCLDSKCTCNTDSYDDNGLTAGGTCMSMTNLKVTNIGFNSLQTNKIEVIWTTIKNYKQYINRFKVIWRPTKGDDVSTESVDLASNSTTYTMTQEIDPGRAYTVTIISINDQTQLGSSRSTSVVSYQAAKPGITSGIDESNCDKDASDGTITVAWYDASGYISGYIVELIDEGTVISTNSVDSSAATFSNTDLKEGYTYSVTIQAKSEMYGGNAENGEIFIAVFKTSPKKSLLDETCNKSSECAEQNKIECRNYKCLCRDGYYQNGTGSMGSCTKRQLGEVCTESNQCLTNNAECRNSSSVKVCQCRIGYFDYEYDGSCSSQKCNKSNQVIIVGVILGLMIILLLAYAGYATYLIRRYRQKGQR